MVATPPIPTQLFLNIRSQDKGLLFQFLLAQFLKVYGAVQELERLYLRLGLDTGNYDAHLKGRKAAQLTEWIQRLAGPETEFLPTFPWNTDNGALAFLYYYARLLTEKTRRKDKDYLQLLEVIEKAFRHAKRSRDLREEWSQQGITPTTTQQRSFANAVMQLIRNVQKCAKLIEKRCVAFSQDENVVFYLVRHSETLNKLYNSSFVEQLLDKMFEGGVAEAEAFLLRRYSKRGFDHLTPLISRHIALVNT